MSVSVVTIKIAIDKKFEIQEQESDDFSPFDGLMKILEEDSTFIAEETFAILIRLHRFMIHALMVRPNLDAIGIREAHCPCKILSHEPVFQRHPTCCRRHCLRSRLPTEVFF